MDLISIKFNVESPEVITAVYERSTIKRKGMLELVQFAKGLGPCGRWVHTLSAEIDFATVRITQESYSEDMSALTEEHTMLQHKILEAAHQGSSGIKFRPRMGEIEKIIQDSRKVETFVYQLGDVRGRIHAVEWRGRQYRI